MPTNIPASDDADRIQSVSLDAMLKDIRELRTEVLNMTPQEIAELIAEERRQRLRETV